MEAFSPCKRGTSAHGPRRDRSNKTSRPRRTITRKSRRENGGFQRNRLETCSKREKEDRSSPQRRKTVARCTNLRRKDQQHSQLNCFGKSLSVVSVQLLPWRNARFSRQPSGLPTNKVWHSVLGIFFIVLVLCTVATAFLVKLKN